MFGRGVSLYKINPMKLIDILTFVCLGLGVIGWYLLIIDALVCFIYKRKTERHATL